MTKKELIDATFQFVFPTPEDLADAHAKEMTLSNMGQTLANYVDVPKRAPTAHFLRTLVTFAYADYFQGSESDEIAKCISDEHMSWVKDAKKDVAKVVKKGLPLTLANARLAWEEKGPFAE